ncbi:hypothetical protein [Rhizobacter sp. Root1221]|uniref:hypothetical protein n=1 Tax=Rhizobacter sp. Root1221 TaxID=1736433 RepID=UPI0006FB25E0|nr:hypothetical protein [Rhizobacter sp. Root1221]KQV82986.1 hypothetical protein ASC87_08520 [Rhizobacter sp. Root1221]
MTGQRIVLRRTAGAVALPVALAMALAMLLYIGIVNGNLLTEQRLSANRHRAAVAFEAADAGIDWMLGRLNAGDPVDPQCERRPAPGRPSFREQHAGLPDAHGAWAPSGLPVACTAGGATWTCQCGSPASVGDNGPTPGSAAAFSVQLEPVAPSHLMRVASTGCSNPAPPCTGGTAGTGQADAQARVELSIAHLPALAQWPAAALTVLGSLQLGSAPWVLLHPDPSSGGLALHTGGAVAADRLVTRGPPGTPAAASMLTADPALRHTDRPHAFAALFGMHHAAWRTLPTVRHVDCASPCDGALRRALGPGGHHTMLWLNGGLHLAEPQQLGTPERPVLVIADGPVSFAHAVTVHGLVYTTASRWQAPAGAEVTGAVVAEGDLHGSGTTVVRHDPQVLQALHERTGTFVRVPGSWKDFP